MKILKTYRFKNGAEVAHIEDYAEATRYSGIIRYFVVADSAKVEVGTFFDWKDAKEKALSQGESLFGAPPTTQPARYFHYTTAQPICQ